jgi:hypothetical protein
MPLSRRAPGSIAEEVFPVERPPPEDSPWPSQADVSRAVPVPPRMPRDVTPADLVRLLNLENLPTWGGLAAPLWGGKVLDVPESPEAWAPVDVGGIVRPQGPASRALWGYITERYPAFARALDKLPDLKYFVGPGEARATPPGMPRAKAQGFWLPHERELHAGGAGQQPGMTRVPRSQYQRGAPRPLPEDLQTTAHEGLHALWSQELPSGGYYGMPNLEYAGKLSPAEQKALRDRLVTALERDLSPERFLQYYMSEPHWAQHALVERGAKKMLRHEPGLETWPW